MHAYEHAFSYTAYTLHDRAGTHASSDIKGCNGAAIAASYRSSLAVHYIHICTV